MQLGQRFLRSAARVVLFGASVLLPACAASDPGAPTTEEHRVDLEGELRTVVVGDADTGAAYVEHFVEVEGGRWLKLVADTPAALPPDALAGALISVSGTYQGTDSLRVHSLKVLRAVEDLPEAPLAVIAPSPKKVAVILAKFANTPATATLITPEQARGMVFTSSDSSNAYFKEVSFDVRTLVGRDRVDGDVYGWFTLPDLMPAAGASCAYSTWGDNARAAVTSAGSNLTGYDHVIHYFPSVSCGFSGVGQVPGKYSWIIGSRAQTISHELGHNFRLQHASSYRCTDQGVNVPISTTCTASEYGDVFDVMGSGYRHLSAFQKGRLGWLEANNTFTVTSAGTFTVTPLEQKSTGIQALRVPIPNTNLFYYVEFRQPFGFDNFTASSAVVNGVLIHRSTDYDGSTKPLLLDMRASTSTFTDASLPVGATFTDAANNIAIKLLSVASSGASVQVTLACTSPETDAAFCSRLGKNCGSVTGNDNCGTPRTVGSCGSCTAPLTCGGGGAQNVCGQSCTAESNAAFCSRLGKNCGSVTGNDNCGTPRTVGSCGSCTAPLTCGGGGAQNVCGQSCIAESNATFCSRLGKNCGSVTGNDNCGTPRTVGSCGSCTAPLTCGGGGAQNVCGQSCTAESNAAFCSRLGKNCGSVTGNDNCGTPRTVGSCGSCTAPLTCGGGGAQNVCGQSCTAESNAAFCSRLGKNCGSVTGNDNCGTPRTVGSCGTCTAPLTCGGGGSQNVCGGSGGNCAGVTPWDPNKPWYQYTVGERHKGSNNELYECTRIDFCYLDPAGPNGHFGWMDRGPC